MNTEKQTHLIEIQDGSDNPENEHLGKAKNLTSQLLKDLLSLVKEQANKQEPLFKEKTPKQNIEPFKTKKRALLNVLIAAPYVMMVAFIISFFWDFDGVQSQIFGNTLVFDGLLKITSVSGLIGYLTNWVAITMLFRPRERRPLLGYGLIPAQKDRIAFRLAQAVSKDLINPDLIQQKIHESGLISKYREKLTLYLRDIVDDQEFRDGMKQLFKEYLQQMLNDEQLRSEIVSTILNKIEELLERKSFEKLALKAYSILKGKDTRQMLEEALHNVPELVDASLDKIDDILDDIPTRIEANAENIENLVTQLVYKMINQLDVHDLVEGNLKKFDESRLENLIKGTTNEQLHYIQYLGAIFGAIGGFVIWEPVVSTLILAAIVGIIFGLDYILYNRRKQI